MGIIVLAIILFLFYTGLGDVIISLFFGGKDDK